MIYKKKTKLLNAGLHYILQKICKLDDCMFNNNISYISKFEEYTKLTNLHNYRKKVKYGFNGYMVKLVINLAIFE